MPTILFEELDDTPTEATGSGFGEIPLVGFAYDDIEALGGLGFGEIPIFHYTAPGYIPPVPVWGEGFGEIALVAAYSFGPAVLAPADGFGEIPLSGYGYWTAHYGLGEISLFGYGYENLGYDDDPDVELAEWLYIGDTNEVREVLHTRAAVALTTPLTVTGRYAAALQETLRARDSIGIIFEVVVNVPLVASATLQGDRLAAAALIDAVSFAGVALTSVSALANLADALVLYGAGIVVQEGDVVDTAELADIIDASARAMVALLSSVAVSGAAEGLGVFSVLVDDAFVVDETLTPTASFLAALAEAVEFTATVTIDGLPFWALAMSAPNKAVTEYTAFDINSLTEFNGQLYGAGAAGLYLLEGDDDAGEPIEATLRTGLLRLANGLHARIDSAYLGYRSDGTLKMKVVYTGEDGIKRGQVYDLQELNARDNRAGRIKVGKGLKSVYWAFELSNTDGADFGLDMLEILPLVMARRTV